MDRKIHIITTKSHSNTEGLRMRRHFQAMSAFAKGDSELNEVVPVSLLLTLKRLNTFFWCFHN